MNRREFIAAAASLSFTPGLMPGLPADVQSQIDKIDQEITNILKLRAAMVAAAAGLASATDLVVAWDAAQSAARQIADVIESKSQETAFYALVGRKSYDNASDLYWEALNQ